MALVVVFCDIRGLFLWPSLHIEFCNFVLYNMSYNRKLIHILKGLILKISSSLLKGKAKKTHLDIGADCTAGKHTLYLTVVNLKNKNNREKEMEQRGVTEILWLYRISKEEESENRRGK